MQWKLIAAIPASAALLLFCWKLRGVMLTPVCRGKNQRLAIVVRVSGASPELEATVDGLLWLLSDGVLFGEVILRDEGMDTETKEIARRLAESREKVTLWTKRQTSSD